MAEMELVTVQTLDFSAVNAASAVRGADDVHVLATTKGALRNNGKGSCYELALDHLATNIDR